MKEAEGKANRALLLEVLRRISGVVEAGRLPICIFDLDSTLFHTAGRNLRILQEFAQAHRRDFPELAPLVDELTVEDMSWSPVGLLQQRGVREETLLGALRAFWRERFFTDDYVVYDHVIPGAADFVSACHNQGALIYYLTGRHVGGMEFGTLRSLLEQGFPWGSGHVILHLKASFEEADVDFKAEAVRQIRALSGEVVATFENEPANANLFQRSFPEALHFWLLTEHSPGAEPIHPEIHPIADFRVPY